MDYRVEYSRNSLSMSEFRARYQNRERYIAYCKECPRYNTVWSCPLLIFDADAYLEEYAWVSVVGGKVILDKQVIEKANTAEKIKTVGWEILSGVKLELESRMRTFEKQLPGSRSLSSGGCNLCKDCSRRAGKPCRKPDKMRYSLDAFGFDLSAITNDLLGIEIQWCKDRLPDYFTLVHGIMTMQEVTNDEWEAMGLEFSA